MPCLYISLCTSAHLIAQAAYTAAYPVYNTEASTSAASGEASQAATAMAEYQQQQSGHPGRINHDYPPFSRIFIVCSKNHKEEDMRQAFAPCGTIEDVWMVKDRMTKESKGICYIKFDKASSAAQAIESMDGKLVANDPKPIKVMIVYVHACTVHPKQNNIHVHVH